MHALDTPEVRRRGLLAERVWSGAWIVASLVPAIFLLRLFALTLYSVPESDDFCFSFTNLQSGFFATIGIFYQTVIGRIVPLALMQVPAAISGATGIDYFICYVATLAVIQLLFAAAIIFLTFRWWPHRSIPQKVCFALALAATILSGAAGLGEMLYWLPGVACYVVPGTIVVLVLAEFVRTAENGKKITLASTCMLAMGCFVASLCNEFTPPWLIGLVLGSLVVRRHFGHDLQIREHALVGCAALIGFAVLLVAPGNAIRLAQFPIAREVGHSAKEALIYSISVLGRFFAEPAILPWLVFVLFFTVAQKEADEVPSRNRRILAALIPVFCLACGYLAYFTHQYATGIRLVTRAQNEAVILLACGLTMSVMLLARAYQDSIRRMIVAMVPGRRDSFIASAIAIVLVAMLIPALHYSKTSKLLRSEQNSFHTFWLESMARHAALSLSTEENLVVAKHSVLPMALMAGDLTADPTRLPNDCVARFYHKKTIVIEPSTMASAKR